MKRAIVKEIDTASLSTDYSYTTAFDGDFVLHSIAIAFNDRYSGDLEVILKSNESIEYDTYIVNQRITDHNDFFLYPNLAIIAGDQIQVKLESTPLNRTVYLSITGEYI